MVTRRPVARTKTFQTMVAVVNLQNATRTPGVSARFTRVELREKPITTPATASAPNALAPSVRVRGCGVDVMAPHFIGLLRPSLAGSGVVVQRWRRPGDHGSGGG